MVPLRCELTGHERRLALGDLVDGIHRHAEKVVSDRQIQMETQAHLPPQDHSDPTTEAAPRGKIRVNTQEQNGQPCPCDADCGRCTWPDAAPMDMRSTCCPAATEPIFGTGSSRLGSARLQ
jgi:hypothetical protein